MKPRITIANQPRRIVAKQGTKVAGELKFSFPQDGAKRGRNAHIEWVYVKPEYRRQGIAMKLLKAFLKFVRSKVVWVSLWTGREIEQKKATKIYKKAGFKQTAYFPDYYDDGVAVRLFTMKLA